MIVINYFGDGGSLFHKRKQLSYIALNLHHDRFVEIHGNIEERLLQLEIAKHKRNSKFNTIIYGSSRSMLIQMKDQLNCSVSGATLEDLIAISEMHKTFNISADTVIFSIDPWIFIENGTRWEALNKYLPQHSKFRFNQKDDKYIQLLSPSYFQASSKVLLQKGYSIHNALPANNNGRILLPDGSLKYPSSRKNDTTLTKIKIQKFLALKKSLTNNITNPDTNRIVEFERLIHGIVDDGAHVTLLILPVPDKIYANDRTILNTTESAIHNLDLSVKIIGSFSPKNMQTGINCFFDEKHLTKQAVHDILNGEFHNVNS